MYRLVLTLSCLTVFVFTYEVNPNRYVFPEPTVEVYYPKGFRVWIPDSPGMQLFAFHGSTNKALNCAEAGMYSKDVVRPTGNRWIYDNKNAVLKEGDILNYWLFVITKHLGYRLDAQIFLVTELLPQPEDFIRPIHKPGPAKGQKPPKNPPSIYPPPYLTTTLKPQQKPSPKPEVSCHCQCPTLPPQTTTLAPITTTSNTIHSIVSIWSESLNNATLEKFALTQNVKELTNKLDHVLKILLKTNNPKLRQLKLSGVIPTTSEPFSFVMSVVREKLLIKEIIVEANRQEDNSIVFELESFEAKLNILNAAKEKLANSRIVITDELEYNNNDNNCRVYN